MPRSKVPSAAQVRGWTIASPATTEQESQPDEQDRPAVEENPLALRHGYSLADIGKAALAVVSVNAGWWKAGDRHDQYDTAWSGIAEYLYTTKTPPTPKDLYGAGLRAVAEEVNADRKAHGVAYERQGGRGSRPRFAAYWYEPPAEPWEDRVIDRIAVEQILPLITPARLEALLALGAIGNYVMAAKVLGIQDGALRSRLVNGRATFSQYWFAPETPPAHRRRDQRVKSYTQSPRTHCSKGHELTPENIRWSRSGPRYKRWECGVCAKIRHQGVRQRRKAQAQGVSDAD